MIKSISTSKVSLMVACMRNEMNAKPFAPNDHSVTFAELRLGSSARQVKCELQ
jgi:hypothetical protein